MSESRMRWLDDRTYEIGNDAEVEAVEADHEEAAE